MNHSIMRAVIGIVWSIIKVRYLMSFPFDSTQWISPYRSNQNNPTTKNSNVNVISKSTVNHFQACIGLFLYLDKRILLSLGGYVVEKRLVRKVK